MGKIAFFVIGGNPIEKNPATLPQRDIDEWLYKFVPYYKIMDSIRHILFALSTVKISRRMNEDSIHRKIMDAFDKYRIKYEHEYKLVLHKRFDFWLDGIILEVKKKKPSKITLLNQLNRYTRPDEVKAVIVVLEKSMDLPKHLNGKPIFVTSLNANWGVAI